MLRIARAPLRTTVLAGAILACTLLAPAVLTHASAATRAPSTPTLSVKPSSGAPGSSFTISGSGWTPSSHVHLLFRDANGVKTSFGNAPTDANGNLSMQVKVPSGAAKGVAHVNGKDRSSSEHANTKFTVT